MSDKIRVLFGSTQTKSESLAGLVRHQTDMEVVGKVVDRIELMLAVKELEPDVVVLESELGKAPGVDSHLLGEYPRLLIVVLDAGSDRVLLCHRVLSQEGILASDEKLLAAIRRALEN